MGLFKNLSTTKILGDAVYPKYGLYWNRIDKVKAGESRLGFKHLIIDYTVIHVLPSSEGPPNHVIGEEACHFIKVTGNEYAAADWAGFMSGMLECKVEELDNPEIKTVTNGLDLDDWATNEDPAKGAVQPMRGMVGEMLNRLQMTKEETNNPSHPFTKTKWKRPVPKSEIVKALTPDQIARFFPGDTLNRLT